MLGLALGLGLGRRVLPSPVAAAGGLGPELVTNGTFGDTSGWVEIGDDGDLTTGTVKIANGRLELSSAISNHGIKESDAALESGATYRCIFTASDHSTGLFRFQLNLVSGTARSANGTYEEDIVAGSNTSFGLRILSATVGGTTVNIDDVSVKKVL